MIIYDHNFTDPYFNLACEEYLLNSTFEDDIFMLWRNSPAVIIGRNQNAFAELNIDYIKNNDIKVVRRLTGGGAVFHDLGNVNFTFITSKKDDTVLNFEVFTRPIIALLNELGAKAELSGRNDIVIDGYKISGNAQCGHNDKVMHHGTLLFEADLSHLADSLKVDKEKIQSKGIKSIRSRVSNIKNFIDRGMDVIGFKSYIEKGINAEHRLFSAEDIKLIQKLADEKYSNWDWVFGQSKNYQYTNKKRYPYGMVEINLNVDGGYISDIRINGDYFGIGDIGELEQRLIGTRYDSKDIYEKLYDIDKFIAGAIDKDILDFMLNIM
jgi:lipoyltransferase and lipoate-protein ligase